MSCFSIVHNHAAPAGLYPNQFFFGPRLGCSAVAAATAKRGGGEGLGSDNPRHTLEHGFEALLATAHLCSRRIRCGPSCQMPPCCRPATSHSAAGSAQSCAGDRIAPFHTCSSRRAGRRARLSTTCHAQGRDVMAPDLAATFRKLLSTTPCCLGARSKVSFALIGPALPLRYMRAATSAGAHTSMCAQPPSCSKPTTACATPPPNQPHMQLSAEANRRCPAAWTQVTTAR